MGTGFTKDHLRDGGQEVRPIPSLGPHDDQDRHTKSIYLGTSNQPE